ncbi:MAG: hypothetical protein OIF57_08750 [Marinobacterium sp.]|nr:hypothetical protein [Marinobacterium sp.]
MVRPRKTPDPALDFARRADETETPAPVTASAAPASDVFDLDAALERLHGREKRDLTVADLEQMLEHLSESKHQTNRLQVKMSDYEQVLLMLVSLKSGRSGAGALRHGIHIQARELGIVDE